MVRWLPYKRTKEEIMPETILVSAGQDVSLTAPKWTGARLAAVVEAAYIQAAKVR